MDFYKPKTHTCTECNTPLQAEPNVIMGAYSVKSGIFRCNRCNRVLAVTLSHPQKTKQTV